jgi:tetratricopeptide (TPR) repeat protein
MKFKSLPERLKITVLFFVMLFFISPVSYAGIWDMDIPIPNNDPGWTTFKTLWDKHWNGENIDQIITCLKNIEQKNPGNLEVNLWLSKAYGLKGKRTNKNSDYRLSEIYAVKAHDINKDDILAFKLLIDAIPNNYNFKEIMTKYGPWIKSVSPLPVGEALPPMPQQPGWERFYQLWTQRYDEDKAVAAVKMLDEMAASDPNDGAVQVWASRGNYYLGEYWSSMDQHDTKAIPYYKKGIQYGEKAKRLLPYSVPATYWYQLNLARSLQFANIFTKAKYLKTFVGLLLFCSYENNLYYYFGPNLTLGTMITNAGWLAEKGMGIAGVSLSNEMTSLELAEILYPDYIYIPYAKADILAYKGKKEEAIKILENILTRNTDQNKFAIAENRCHQRFSRLLYNKLKKEK